jgi:ribosomal protein S18 acetylase RimI-like enzyme
VVGEGDGPAEEQPETRIVQLNRLQGPLRGAAIDQIMEIMEILVREDGQEEDSREAVERMIDMDETGINQIATDDQGTVLGFILGDNIAPNVALIKNMGNRKASRGQKIGRRFLNTFAANAQAAGMTTTIVGVRHDNPTAQVIYGGYGFQEGAQGFHAQDESQGFVMSIPTADLIQNTLPPSQRITIDRNLFVTEENQNIQSRKVEFLQLIYEHLRTIGNNALERFSESAGLGLSSDNSAFAFQKWYGDLLRLHFDRKGTANTQADLYWNIATRLGERLSRDTAIPFYVASAWKRDQEAQVKVQELTGKTIDQMASDPTDEQNNQCLSIIFKGTGSVTTAAPVFLEPRGVEEQYRAMHIINMAAYNIGQQTTHSWSGRLKTSLLSARSDTTWIFDDKPLIRHATLEGTSVLDSSLQLSADQTRVSFLIDGQRVSVDESGNIAAVRSEVRIVAQALFNKIIGGNADVQALENQVNAIDSIAKIDGVIAHLRFLKAEAERDADLLGEIGHFETRIGVELIIAETEALITAFEGILDQFNRKPTAGVFVPENADRGQLERRASRLARMGAQRIMMNQNKAGFAQMVKSAGMVPDPGLNRSRPVSKHVGLVVTGELPSGTVIDSSFRRVVYRDAEQVNDPHINDFGETLQDAVSLLIDLDPDAALLKNPVSKAIRYGLVSPQYEGPLARIEGDDIVISALYMRKYLEWKAAEQTRISA